MQTFAKIAFSIIITISAIFSAVAQPDWSAIKSGATFIVPDTAYRQPYLQPINVGGWEDGLFITRDGKHLFSTYLPVDVFSWLYDLVLDPVCFDFGPYYRPPLFGIDTVTNIFGCAKIMHSDIIISSRTDTSKPFSAWQSSNLRTSFSYDGGAHGVLLNNDMFDVFVFTKDGPGTQSTDIMFMRNVPVNPNTSSAVAILSTPGKEDNPHIERLDAQTLLLIFDRERYIYYSLSKDNGDTWQEPLLMTHTLNDQAPFDVQPHLWDDGTSWWVYFCANNANGVRCIYKAKQLIVNDWDSWGEKELVIEPGTIAGGSGTIFGIGEPTLTQWGDISFVAVYGNNSLPDTTDAFDCDPWLLPRKHSPLVNAVASSSNNQQLRIFPNPATNTISVELPYGAGASKIQIVNAQGTVVKDAVANDAVLSIPVGDLPRGTYHVRMLGRATPATYFEKR